MTETKKLKEMLSQGWKEVRASKNKTWPRFGIEMFLLQCIIQCNKALSEKKSEDSEQKTRITNGPGLPGPLAMARGSGLKLQATSRKLQASSRKLDKIKLLCYPGS